MFREDIKRVTNRPKIILTKFADVFYTQGEQTAIKMPISAWRKPLMVWHNLPAHSFP